MGYGPLNLDEREVILNMRAQQASMQEIGKRLGRSKWWLISRATVA